tara:strand:- start:136 stop:840 length:705 start_codon:yes stop_codon:yes gene_type:complete
MQSVQLITRGELYRFGIGEHGLVLQRDVFSSIRTHVIRPLSTTFEFQLEVGVDTRRGYPPTFYTGEVFRRVVADPRARVRLVNETSQARQFASIVASVQDTMLAYDYVFVMRHDVRVLRPLATWGCGADLFSRLVIPALITPHLVNDLYIGVPRSLNVQLFRLLFGPTRCWSLNSTEWAAQLGHHCGDVFREHGLPFTTCTATVRVRHHSPNYTTHILPECHALALTSMAWRCG